MPTSQPSPAIKRVLGRLIALGKPIEQRGAGWRVGCPGLGHEDVHPSCDINTGDNGYALLCCRSKGCSQETMLAGLGLTKDALRCTPDELREWQGGGGYKPGTDPNSRTAGKTTNGDNNLTTVLPTVLLPNSRTGQADSRTAPGDTAQDDRQSGSTDELPQGLTLDAYAAAKQLPREFLAQLWLSTIYLSGMPVVNIPYKNEAGVVVAQQFRRAMQRGEHEDGRFMWSRKGTKPILYGLWRLPEMRKSTSIAIVEGASDAQTLWWYDVSAVGLPGAGAWQESWAPFLDGFETIYIIHEGDKGADAIEDWVTDSSIRHRVKFVSFDFLSSAAQQIKDPSDLHCKRSAAFRECWEEALKRAVPWAEVHRQRTLKHVSDLYREIKDLLEDPHLLTRLKKTFADMGYVGDTSPTTLIYLAMTSRVLPRPMNATCIGPSSVGKNATVDAAKALIPSEDIYQVDAASPMALVYTDASFERKIVLYSEMDSIPEDGPAGSAVRSLAATNELTYDVVEKNKSGKYQTRHICKAGPTVLITTGIKSPGQQLGTRLLEVAVSDAPEQTWDILDRQTLEASGQAPKVPDLQPWIDLQRWLCLQPAHVQIPFGNAVLKALKQRLQRPPTRLRRDFKQLLSCIATITLLYQCQRELAPGGAVVATWGDYEEARVLLEPVFATITTEGVTKAIRETVEQVGPDEEVSISELARRLQLSKTATYARVERALIGGWLINREEREGKRYPAKLVRGADLPENRPVLPTKDELQSTPPPTDPETTSSAVEQSVSDGTTEQVAAQYSPGQPDCSSGTTVEQAVEQQLNNEVSMENPDCSTVLLMERDLPPSPLPPDNDALAQSSTSSAEMPPKLRPKKKTKAPVVEVGPTYDPGPYLYIKEATELEKVLPTILEAPELAIDIETTGLSHIRDRIRLVQLATPEQSILVDVFHVPIEMLTPVLQGNRTLYGQNLKFDLKFLLHAGLPYPTTKLKDPMLLAQILGADDEPPLKDLYTLATLAKKHFGVNLDKRWQKGPWDGELCEEQLRYAAIDAKILFPLIIKLRLEMLTTDLEKIVDLEHRCLLPLIWLERAGMGVDAVAWRGLAEKIMERKPILEDELAQLTLAYAQERKEKRRGEPINWHSPQQVLAVLRDRGIQVDTTATKVLQAFSNDPVVERFLEWAPLAKRSSSFGEKWVSDYFDTDTGRVYPSFQQLGSRAGRMSCREPNLQQIPKDIDYRGCFRASDGYRLVGGDYSQIELRVMAFLTKEPALLDAFARDIDVHKQTAAQLFNVPYDAVTPEQRAQAKTINFGVIYGMGPRGLAARTGSSEPEAQAFLDRYFTTYKKIKQYKYEQLSRARQTGEVRTILGRRRLLPRIHDRGAKDWYQVRNMTVNTPIQGSAADAFKLAFIRLFEHRDEVPDVRLTNLIHDEIVCETPVDQVELTKAWLNRHMVEAMREMVQDGVPIKVDLKEGQSWAE